VETPLKWLLGKRREDNTKMELDCEDEKWVELAQNRVQWQDLCLWFLPHNLFR